MPIRKKLLLAFWIIALLSACVAFLVVVINSLILNDVTQIEQISIEESKISERMDKALHGIEIDLRNGSNKSKPEAIKAALGLFKESLDDLQKSRARAMALAEKEESLEEMEEVRESSLRVDVIHRNFDSFARLTAGGKTDPGSLALLYERLHNSVEEYQANAMSGLEGEVRAVERWIRLANIIFFSSAIALFLIGSVMAWRISKTISQPLGMMTHAAEEIARGNLNISIDFQSKDEIGLLVRTFNQMTMDLQSTTVSKAYLDRILASMANALIVLGPDRKIRSSNNAAQRMLGYSDEELKGMDMDRILGEPSRAAESILSQVAKEGALTEVELFYQTKLGKVIPVGFSASTLDNERGKTTGFVCVAQDISARKKTEQELDETGKKLLETSHQTGMAEVAASILHNVGNVLNSVNVSGAVLAGKINASKAANLSKAVALLQEHASDLAGFLTRDPKGQLLPGYLTDLAGHLEIEKKELLLELESLLENIKHIKEIVAMQQAYAKISGVAEECDIVELVETAIRINADSLERHHVRLVREFADLPPARLQKHKILQILVNLLSNAKHACEENGRLEKEIVIRTANGGGRLKISIIDNGVGILSENLSRIFNHGFTTKKNGHGFGLHGSALAARDLGGELTAASGGPGQGSAFILEVPFEQPEAFP